MGKGVAIIVIDREGETVYSSTPVYAVIKSVLDKWYDDDFSNYRICTDTEGLIRFNFEATLHMVNLDNPL